MKNRWWNDRADELQLAADQGDTKRFFDGLRAVYGPKTSGLSPLRSADGNTLITDREGILKRWAEHFNSLLNRPSSVNQDAIDEIPQFPTQGDLSLPPSLAETTKAIKQM